MADVIATETVAKSRILSVFDFDGTLTHHDSFIRFLYFAFNKSYFIKHLMCMISPILYYICHKLTKDELKEALIKIFLTNVEEYWLRQKSEHFCEKYWVKLMRQAGVLAVEKEVNSGAEVVICSASPELILKPFVDRLNTKLIGTQLEVENGKLTGRIIGHNCRCMQKVVRLKNIYGDLNYYYLRAWGDSRGDYELLKVAQDPHWKQFHRFIIHRNISNS